MQKPKNPRAATFFEIHALRKVAVFTFERNRYYDDRLDGTEQNLDLSNDVT